MAFVSSFFSQTIPSLVNNIWATGKEPVKDINKQYIVDNRQLNTVDLTFPEDKFLSTQKIKTRKRTVTINEKSPPPIINKYHEKIKQKEAEFEKWKQYHSEQATKLKESLVNTPFSWLGDLLGDLISSTPITSKTPEELYDDIQIKIFEGKQLPTAKSGKLQETITYIDHAITGALDKTLKNRYATTTNHYRILRDTKILLEGQAGFQQALQEKNAHQLVDYLHSSYFNSDLSPAVHTGLLKGEIKLKEIPKQGNPWLFKELKKQADSELLDQVEQEIVKKYPQSNLISLFAKKKKGLLLSR